MIILKLDNILPYFHTSIPLTICIYFAKYYIVFFLFFSRKMDALMLRFPHLPEKIFQKLNNKSLFKSREVARSWQDLIDRRKYPWLRIVNIPTILEYRNTYLHLAAETGQIEAFQTAFSEQKDKNIVKKFGQTPFHLACMNGRFEIVQFLLKNSDLEFNVNAKEMMGNTPFILACWQGSSHVVKILMENALAFNIDLNAKNAHGRTAFQHACIQGNLLNIGIFIENAAALKIDLSTKDKYGSTCFHHVCFNGDTYFCKIFMENATAFGIDLNAKNQYGMTAFLQACQKGHKDVVKMFMVNAGTFGINLNTKDNFGWAGFHHVCKRFDQDLATIFIENATKLNLTAFHIECLKGRAIDIPSQN